jgi:hypothetical protein
MISFANNILKTTVDLAVDLYSNSMPWTDVVKNASHDIGLQWAMVFDTNETNFTNIRYWNGVSQFGKKIEAQACHPIQEWASKKNQFAGRASELPFETEFVPRENDGYVLFVPEYRSENSWGASGLGCGRKPNTAEAAALSRFGKFLISVVRRKEQDNDIRRNIEQGILKIRQHMAPV